MSNKVVLAVCAVGLLSGGQALGQLIAVESFPFPPYTTGNLNAQAANIPGVSQGFGLNPWNTNTANVQGNDRPNPFAGFVHNSPGRMNSLGFLPDQNIRGGWRTLATYTPIDTYYMGGVFATGSGIMRRFSMTGWTNALPGPFNDFRASFEDGGLGVRGLMWGNEGDNLAIRFNDAADGLGMRSVTVLPNFVRNSFYFMGFRVEVNQSGNNERITYWVTNSPGTLDRSLGGAGLTASAQASGVILADIMDTNADLARLKHTFKEVAQTFPDDIVLGGSVTDLIVPQFRWITDGPGSWNNPGNWSYNTVPNAAGAEVRFAPGLASSPVITIDTPVTAGSLTYLSANPYTVQGPGSLTLDGPVTPTIAVGAGNSVISAPLVLGRNTNITTTGPASLRLDNVSTATGSETLSVSGTGTVRIGQTYVGGQISVTELTGARVLLDPGARAVIRGGNLAALREDVRVWWADGNRFGGGLGAFGSAPGVGSPLEFTTIAVRLNDDDSGFPTFATFAGVPVGLNDILVMYTYQGDVNLDGLLDAIDFNALLNGMTNGLTGWRNGDINYDGVVDGFDYGLLLAAMAGQGAPFDTSGNSVGVIPEPASAGLLLAAGGLLLGRRRRKPA